MNSKEELSKLRKYKFLVNKFERIIYEDKTPEDNQRIFERLFFQNTLRFYDLKARQLETQKTEVERDFQYDMIERIDRVTLIMEEFLDTNKALLNKMEEIRNEFHGMSEKEEGELIEIQDLSEETIEKLIFDYLKEKKKKTVYPSDIAIAFNLDTKKVFDICQSLKEEGRLV